MKFNIVFGKVEQIQDMSLGRLIVTTDCDSETLNEIIGFFEEHLVKVEVVNG